MSFDGSKVDYVELDGANTNRRDCERHAFGGCDGDGGLDCHGCPHEMRKRTRDLTDRVMQENAKFNRTLLTLIVVPLVILAIGAMIYPTASRNWHNARIEGIGQ